jgi:hypothetical protein
LRANLHACQRPRVRPLSGGHILWKSPTARFLLPLRRRGNRIWRDCCFLSSVIPAEAGIQRPKTRHSPWIPACAGMTATERSENPNAIALPLGAGWSYGVDTSCGSHRRRDFFSLSAGGAIAFGETVAFLSSVIPAEAGIQRPKTRHSPWIPACAGMTVTCRSSLVARRRRRRRRRADSRARWRLRSR